MMAGVAHKLRTKVFLERPRNLIYRELYQYSFHIRGRPFDIRGGGGGGWVIFQKKFLSLVLKEKNNLSLKRVKKNNLSLKREKK